jgi:hypothetical protein
MFKPKKSKGSFEEKYTAEQKKLSRSRFRRSVKAFVGKTFGGTGRARFASYAGVLLFAGVGSYALAQSMAATSKEASWVVITVRDANTKQPIAGSWSITQNVNPNGSIPGDPLNCYSGSGVNTKQMPNGSTAWHCHVGSNNVEDYSFRFHAGPGYRPHASQALAPGSYIGAHKVTIGGNANCKATGTGCAGVTYNLVFELIPEVVVNNPPPAPPAQPDIYSQLGVGPVYRMVRPSNGTYLYTMSATEWNSSEKHGFKKEGAAFYAATKSSGYVKPVYRMVRPSTGVYFYTMDINEWNNADKHGFRKEGVAFYASDHKFMDEIKPVYRMVRPSNGVYLYTTSITEWNNADKHGFRKEGVAFYAL